MATIVPRLSFGILGFGLFAPVAVTGYPLLVLVLPAFGVSNFFP